VRAHAAIAKTNNLRLVVKSTGHDYMGRCNAPNSLSIWTHHLKGASPVDAFRPQACDNTIQYGPAVKLGAGMQMADIYRILAPLNRTIVGGTSSTVSIAGFVTGGGHSVLTPRYGMGADQVLEMELVTPAGDIVIANECQNTDLFWALRGGGGSTFGILSSVTVKTVPSPQMLTYNFFITTPPANVDVLLDVFTYMTSQFPYLSSQNLSGYTYIYPDCPSRKRMDNSKEPLSCFYGAFTLQDSNNASVVTARMAPTIDHIRTTWPAVAVIAFPLFFPNHEAWSLVYRDIDDTGVNQYLGGRLLDRQALSDDLPRLGRALSDFATILVGTAFLVAPSEAREPVPGSGNAVLPAWRKAYVHALNAVQFDNPSDAARDSALAALNSSLVGLRELAPTTGAYINEAYPYEPNWEQTFWGAHYDTLLSIKRAVDPGDVLWCYPCVGSSRWEEVEGHLCKTEE